ncbi:midnolin isoform X2 [Prionailurus viverrinus]|uniref:midnolin isoform X2 n=1 Tax=Prionailurus bengalensis TaxID=37029 RepID=UPI001CA9A748|nr:midnolin isoform X2 [Prionailurus bengalensis]XP_047704261.1 midnolin isoform X2 [Prionailurus viverrinus]
MEPQPGGARSCRRGAPGGACELGPAAEAAPMSLAIHSTTGTRYELSVPPDETVEGLRKRLSQRLKVPKERLALLHKDTRLSSGKLQEFGVGDGSKLTLVPTVEAGLMSQASRPEQSVMQALESLTETQPPVAPGPGRAGGGVFRKYRFILFKHPWHRQGPQSPERGGERPQVSDFLSGRSPLTLALRVGDHMMFVQLQLAAQHTPLQHRHVLAAAAAAAAAARGGPSVTAPVSSPCRPVSSAARVPPVSSSPAPASPSPVTAGSFRSHSAATCPEMDCSPPASAGSLASTPGGSPASTPGGSPASRSRKPGAVIESFVNHAPGVFSGTFSGTLHPNCQDSSGRPRRDIGTILQILNDLLSATRHYQGMPPSLTQLRCHAQCAPASPAPDLTPKTTSCEKLAAAAPTSLSQARTCKPLGDRLRQTENRATRCKVERLQLLLQQKRLRRKARRDARGPYHWPPSRKAGRSDTSGGGGGGGPSEASGLGLDFEDSVWKPEVNPDIKSEFVVA